MTYAIDRLVLTPHDIDLARSPLAGHLDAETYVLGAFNPGMTKLPNGNLLLMVRVAEALRQPIYDGHVHAIRWEDDGANGRYVLDAWPLEHVDTADPRKFMLRGGGWKIMALTSLSWLLPVEVTPDGLEIVTIHYDRAITPRGNYQCYGVEDARISRVEGRYLMTTCSVSPERHSTTIYTSDDALDWKLGITFLDKAKRLFDSASITFCSQWDAHLGKLDGSAPGRGIIWILRYFKTCLQVVRAGVPALKLPHRGS